MSSVEHIEREATQTMVNNNNITFPDKLDSDIEP